MLRLLSRAWEWGKPKGLDPNYTPPIYRLVGFAPLATVTPIRTEPKVVGPFAGPFAITDSDGKVLAYFTDEWERNEALMTGEYPDDAEPAFIN